MAWITSCLQFVLETVTLSVNVIHLGLLSEDLITEGQHALVSISSDQATARVLVLHIVDHQTAVSTRSEEIVVAIAEAHSLDWTSMGLHLAEHLHRELPDLDRAWMALFADTCKECFPVGEYLDLRDCVACFTAIVLVRCIPKLSVRARNKRSMWLFVAIFVSPSSVIPVRRGSLKRWNVDYSQNLGLLILGEVLLLAALILIHLLLKFVEEDLTLAAAVSESRIVLKPVDLHDVATVTSALEARWALSRVEVVNVGVIAHADSKQVASIAESDLTALLHGHRVVVRKRARQYVVEHEFVPDRCHDMETIRVKRNGCGFLTRWVLQGHLELLFSPVPDADVACRTCHD